MFSPWQSTLYARRKIERLKKGCINIHLYVNVYISMIYVHTRILLEDISDSEIENETIFTKTASLIQ